MRRLREEGWALQGGRALAHLIDGALGDQAWASASTRIQEIEPGMSDDEERHSPSSGFARC